MFNAHDIYKIRCGKNLFIRKTVGIGIGINIL